MRQPSDPYRIKLTEEQRKCLGLWLGRELEDALAARSANAVDVDYYWTLYEQGRTRSPADMPWPDAADLTSYIPTEKVDAVHARLMRTIFAANPIATVEGFGTSASQAPLVEEFHQWKAEEERLQSVLDKTALMGLVEPRALIEVYESSERRTSRKRAALRVQQSDDGMALMQEDGSPSLAMNQRSGEYDAAGPDDVAAEAIIDHDEIIRTGPQYRVLPYADSLILPGHARDKPEIWGYAKRIWPRKSVLLAQAETMGTYDLDAVKELTDVSDRTPSPSLLRAKQDIAPQNGIMSEKELWECLVLMDCNAILEEHNVPPIKSLDDGTGARWYLMTLHLGTHNLLRLDYDDFSRSRYVPFILFPRSDRATEGFSLIGHKLLTVTEEHTAYRNMAADRSSCAVNAPIKKLIGALWDEDEQPWGPKAVITVRDHREIQQQQVADVPASVFSQIAYCDRTAERLAGVNDLAAGVNPAEDRTLGENRLATAASEIRIQLIVSRFQEAMEELYIVRHAMWKRVLAERPEGIDAPESLIGGIESRGLNSGEVLPQNKITAAMLEGAFRFRPYGSVENADLNREQIQFTRFLQALAPVFQIFPMLHPMFATPQAARAMGRQMLRVFRVPNQQAFLGSPMQDFMQQQMLDRLPMAPAIPPIPGVTAPPQAMGMGQPPGMGMPPQMGGMPQAPQGEMPPFMQQPSAIQ